MSPNVKLDPSRFSAAVAAGFNVFPIVPRDKRPAVKWTIYRDQPANPDQVAEWDKSDFNVGVICGATSGVVVIDIDNAEAQEFYDALGLPQTPHVQTAKGRHYYFKSPSEVVRNRVAVNGSKIDVRGADGYVVGAGSIHETGAMYKWLVSPSEIDFAEMPKKLLDLVRNSNPKRVPVLRSADCLSEFGKEDRLAARLEYNASIKVGELRKATEGNRNDTLFRVAVALANDVAGAGADWKDYTPRLREEALALGLPGQEIDSTLASAWRIGSELPTKWMVVAREWVYLSNPQLFYHLESGNSLRRAGFNDMFADALKKSISTVLLKGGFIKTFFDLTYQPRSIPSVIAKDGLEFFNSYRPPDIRPEEGDPTPFEDFLEYLVPDQRERAHLLAMIAFSVRNPGLKIRHALLLRSAAQGIGKSMLIEIWGALLGEKNVRKTTTEEVNGPYQGYMKETLLVVLEELNWGFGPTGYTKLKDLITSDSVTVNEKYIPVREWPNYATIVILTNVRTPMMIEEKDRRFFYVDSPAQPRPKEFYREFAGWWKSNLGVIRNFLEQVNLSDFDPSAPPPMTDAKFDLIASSTDNLTRELSILIEERSGVFDRDVVTLDQIELELGNIMRFKNRSDLRNALTNIGGVPLGQQRVNGTWIDRAYVTGGQRVSVWAIRHGDYWREASNADRAEEYARTEGVFAAFDPAMVFVLHGQSWPGGEVAFIRQFSKG